MKKLLLRLLQLTAEKVICKTGTKAPLSGIWLSGKEYIALTKGERFPPGIDNYWTLVVSV